MWCKTIDSLTFEVNKVYNINATPMGLCFTYVKQKNANCSIKLRQNSSPNQIALETCTYNASTNTYTNWGPYTVDTYIVLNNVGDKVYFRAGSSGNSTFSQSTSKYYYFYSLDTVEVSGNIMYLLSQTPSTTFPTGSTYTFCRLFKAMDMLTSAEKLVLPATTLVEGCYSGMFLQCNKLTKAPELPTTSLAEKCYIEMFYYCTELTEAPELPATSLKKRCYEDMFGNCNKLTKAPELKANTLENSCYFRMFEYCYSLKNVTMLATDIPSTATNCLNNWLDNAGKNVSDTKTVNIESTLSNTTGTVGATITANTPSGWTISNGTNSWAGKTTPTPPSTSIRKK